MTADQVLVLTVAVGLMGLIYWFFLGKKEVETGVSTNIKVTVSGGYSPSTMYVPVNRPVKLTFLRTDPNSCLEELVIPDLKIKKVLPLHSPVTVTLTVSQPGDYPFHCGMNMYHGRIVAK